MRALRFALATMSAAACACLAVPVAEACLPPHSGDLTIEASQTDHRPPQITSVETRVSRTSDSACSFDGIVFDLEIVDPDTEKRDELADAAHAIGVRLEQLDDDSSILQSSGPLVANSSSRVLEETGALSLSMDIVAFELPSEPTVWRLTPVDRAGNEGEPVIVDVEAAPDVGACGVGAGSGLGGFFLVFLALWPMRCRRLCPRS